MSHPASEGEEEVTLNPEEEEQLREMTNKDNEYDYQLVPAKKKMRKKKKSNKGTGQTLDLDSYLQSHGGKLTVNFREDRYPEREHSGEGSHRTGSRGGRSGHGAGRGDRTGGRGHQKSDKSNAGNQGGNQGGSPSNAPGSGSRGNRGGNRGGNAAGGASMGGRQNYNQGNNNKGGSGNDYHNNGNYQNRQQTGGSQRGGRGGRRMGGHQGRYNSHGTGRQAGGYPSNFYGGNKGGRYGYTGGYSGYQGNMVSPYMPSYENTFPGRMNGGQISAGRNNVNTQELEQMYPGCYLYTTVEGVFVFQSKDDFLNSIKPKLLQQIEYYFSANNLNKDTYLRGQMDEEGYVDIEVIANFRRVRDLTTDRSIIEELLKRSTALEIVDNKIRGKDNWKDWLAKEPTPSANKTETTAAATTETTATPAADATETEKSEEKKEEVAAPSSAQI